MNIQCPLILTRPVARLGRPFTTVTSSYVVHGRTLSTSQPSLNPSSSSTHTGENASSQEKRHAQEDRTAIDRQSDETSKSGTDDVVAAQANISYSSEHTSDPSELISKADRQNPWSNPLDASPANRSMSDSTAEVETGAKKRTILIEEERGTYRGKKKDGDARFQAGFEKKVFAGSTTGGKKKGADHQHPPVVQQGVRTGSGNP